MPPEPLCFRLTPKQSIVEAAVARFKVCVAGRRSGKTWWVNQKLVQKAARNKRSLCWFIGTTLDDARELMYVPVKELLEDIGLLSRHNDTNLQLWLPNGSVIRGLSETQPKRGRGVNYAALDEFAHWTNFDDVWQQEIRPALADNEGEADFATTPAGMNHAYDLFQRGDDPDFPDWQSFTWTSLEGGQISAKEIAAARADLDERVFRQEFEASFETLAGRVYSNFHRNLHVREDIQDLGGELLVGMDFNVNPMTYVLASRSGDQCHIFDCVQIMTSNTEEAAQEIRNDYPDRKVVVCPDPSGRARKTSAPVGMTDFSILESKGFEIRAPMQAPLVVDRVNNMQSLLLSGDGSTRLFMHPRCRPLIRSMEGLVYKKGTSAPDKSSGLDHPADAAGYLTFEEFNVLMDRTVGTFDFSL